MGDWYVDVSWDRTSAIFKKKFCGEILHSVSDDKGHFLLLVVSLGQNILILVNIYGYYSSKENKVLLNEISDKIQYWVDKFPKSSIILGRDVNVVINGELDRFSSRATSTNSILNKFMLIFSVVDIWREKIPQQKVYTRIILKNLE